MVCTGGLEEGEGEGGGYFFIRGWWGYAAGRGYIFTTAVDYSGVAFSIELLKWGHTFSDFWG